MIPPIIHQIWVGPNDIPDSFLKSSEELQRINRGYRYMLWNNDNVEQLATKDVYDYRTFAGQSNVLRLLALKKFGGIYLDMDFVPLKSFDSILRHSAFIARQPDGVFCNAAMGAEPEHSWIDNMLTDAISNKTSWLCPSFGCHVISKYLEDTVSILPTDTFYTYNFDETPKPPTDNTIALHLWEGSWLNK